MERHAVRDKRNTSTLLGEELSNIHRDSEIGRNEVNPTSYGCSRPSGSSRSKRQRTETDSHCADNAKHVCDSPCLEGTILKQERKFQGLPVDVWGIASTFLDLASVRNLIFSLAATDAATSIRQCYLKRNFLYLARQNDLFDVSTKRRAASNFLAWMEVNTDWKAMYDWDAAQFSGGESSHTAFGRTFSNLHRAACIGLLDVVRHLVESRSYDVNASVLIGSPAMCIRCKPVYCALTAPISSDVLAYLLSLDDVDIGYTMNVSRGGNLISYVMETQDDVKINRLRLLLAHARPEEVNDRDRYDLTALHVACECLRHDSEDRVRSLLQAGADPRLRGCDDETPREMLMRIWEKRKAKEGLDDSLRDAIASLLQQHEKIWNETSPTAS